MRHEKYKKLAELTVKNISRRKLRSILTIIAVVIGIATIVSLFLISDGLFNYVEDVFLTMGINTIFIFPASFESMPSHNVSRVAEEIKMTPQDLKLIERIPEVDYAISFSYRPGKIEYKGEDSIELVIMMDPKKAIQTFEILNIDFREGKSFQGKDAYEVVIGPKIADKLFKEKIKVGKKIKIQGQEFKVVGILKPMGNDRDDSQIYIPIGKGNEIFDLKNNFDQLYISVNKNYDPLDVKEKIKTILDKEHGKDKILIITAKQILTMIKTVLSLLKMILISIALVSIIVGSVGIVNSIYTSVIERTGEIGILKSLGAKRKDIYFIFTFESIILSVIGGIIGLGFGIGIAKGVEWYAASQGFSTLKIVITWKIIAIAIGLSLIIGLVSGLLPSMAATKMNAVDALRKNV